MVLFVICLLRWDVSEVKAQEMLMMRFCFCSCEFRSVVLFLFWFDVGCRLYMLQKGQRVGYGFLLFLVFILGEEGFFGLEVCFVWGVLDKNGVFFFQIKVYMFFFIYLWFCFFYYCVRFYFLYLLGLRDIRWIF